MIGCIFCLYELGMHPTEIQSHPKLNFFSRRIQFYVVANDIQGLYIGKIIRATVAYVLLLERIGQRPRHEDSQSPPDFCPGTICASYLLGGSVFH